MRIAVYGSGGHGKVVADIVAASDGDKVVAFFDDDAAKDGLRVGTINIYAPGERLQDIARERRVDGVALGIGDNESREAVAQRCRSANLRLIRAVHPKAVLSPSVTLGEGVVIMAGAVVNPYARLEEGVCINTSASVDHDCVIHRYAHVWPGARLAGSVEVGEYSYIGMGASVIQNVRIGKRVTVGAGAVVLHDLDDGVTAVGVPARRTKP